MDKVTYNQNIFTQWVTNIFNLLGLGYPIYLLIKFLQKMVETSGEISLVSLAIVSFLAIFLSATLILTANYFCAITADKNGLTIRFLWKNLHVNWSEVVEIKPTIYNFSISSQKSWVVLTRSLTPFHRLYGLIYGFSLLPGFIISPGFERNDELVRFVQSHTRK